ncbi:hypothetical protein RMCBS344292_09389 [Rhizopus microsporus]|nr:hypothetical protein RMCBS344292_09389 [Rhizopus microsporus]
MKITFSNLCSHAFHQVKISPDGQYVANAVANRLVIRRSGEELPVIHVFECSRSINYIQWSPNSECILTVNYEFSRIEVHSIMDPKWTAHVRDPSFPIALAQWTADSKSILCTAEMGSRLAIWNLSKKEQRYINSVKFRDKCIETSPDGKYTAVIHKRSGKDVLGIYHSASFISLQQFEVNTVDLDNMKWSPDSSCIAIWDNCLYHTLSVYRPDGYLCTTYSGYEHGLGIKTVNWSQDRKLLAIGNYDQTIHLLSTMSWNLITTLEHPSTLNNSTAHIQLFEETTFAKPQIPTLETVIAYQIIVKRPFNLPSLRLDYNQPNPKVGIGVCQFSKDGNYLASRNDNIPTALWIWDVNRLICRYIVLFRNTIKQILWNPRENGILAIVCGDENIHFMKLTAEEGIEFIPSTVPTSKKKREKTTAK